MLAPILSNNRSKLLSSKAPKLLVISSSHEGPVRQAVFPARAVYPCRVARGAARASHRGFILLRFDTFSRVSPRDIAHEADGLANSAGWNLADYGSFRPLPARKAGRMGLGASALCGWIWNCACVRRAIHDARHRLHQLHPVDEPDAECVHLFSCRARRTYPPGL